MNANHHIIETRMIPRLTALTLVLCIGVSVAGAADDWPPMPRIDPLAAAEQSAPLPPSVQAKALEKGRYQCHFEFHPPREAEMVTLCGTFNDWDTEATPMEGPDPTGDWHVELVLPTGVHEYKFLVNGTDWFPDPRNADGVPDSFGSVNSVLRLGQLSRMKRSDGQPGDGAISAMGLAHSPDRPLYIQPIGDVQASFRYRTLANDVKQVALVMKDGPQVEMDIASQGPLFTYWEKTVELPAGRNGLRSAQYTFQLNDGEGWVSDPYPYYYTIPPSGHMTTPAWAKEAVWYQIMLDRFRNGDPDNDPERTRVWTSAWFEPAPWEGKDGQTFYEHFVFDRFYGGDIAGLEEKLPYLKDLGVNALYLTPIFKAPSYHKYDVQNYLHIDDGFGTRGDYDDAVVQEDLLDPSTWTWTETDQRFLAFVRKAHQMGFKIILDGVFNHVGIAHPAFQDVIKNGEGSRFADWFEVTSWKPFAYQGWEGFADMPVFRKSRLGFASPNVKKHIFAVTQRWMDPDGDGDPSDGVDGWRLDVPQDIPRPFWLAWRRHVKQINPDALIVGEVWNRADEWLFGRHFDAVMNYEFARTVVAWVFDQERKISASEAAARLAELRLAYLSEASYVLQNLIDSHDTDRLVSMAANPDRDYDRQNRVQDNNPDYDNSKPGPEAYARARLAALLQMTYLGAPMIYYGDEVGMWGADDPSNRKPMLWKDLEPYAKPDDNHVMDDHLAFYRECIALRNAHPALQTGTYEGLLADDAADVLAYLRSDDREHVMVVLNASSAPRVVHVPLPDGAPTKWQVEMGAGDTLEAKSGILSIDVPAIDGIVLQAGK